MSSSSETQAAEEVKAEVRQTIRQLSELSRSEASYDQFCQTVLDRIVRLTGAHGALLWQMNGRFPMVTHRAAGQRAEQVAPVAQEHADLVAQVVAAEKEAVRHSRELPSQPEAEQGESIAYLMLLAPLFNSRKECNGAIELLQREDVSDSARDGYLRFLTQIAQLFARWHEHRDLQVLSRSAEKWNEKMDFMTEVHRTIDFNETVYAIANETRRLLNCDRVSVARWNGSRCKVVAISSQDRFDNRANVVRKLGHVATAAVSANTPLWIVGETEGLAPEVARRINDYLDEAHSRTLAVLPLVKEPPRGDDLEMQNRRPGKVRRLGALVLEFFDADVREEEIHEDVEMIVEQSQLAVANSRTHSEIFMLPLWQRVGWLQQLLLRDHRAKTMTALAVLAALVLALIFWPAELKMKVEGVIHPTIRRNIFAETEGVVRELYVSENQEVAAGQVLMELENPQLEIQIADLEGQIEVIDEQLRTIEMRRAQTVNATQEDLVAIAGQRKQLSQQRANVVRKLEVKKEERESQRIYSPIDGTIMTWNIESRLVNLPVQPNQIVMAVSDKSGPWEVEVRIPQNKVGYVTKAIADQQGQPLPVQFIVGTNANQRATGRLVRIADRADVGETGIPEFRGIVQVDIGELSGVRPGAGVTAKIECGQHRLGFVWFHQILDFLRTRVFF